MNAPAPARFGREPSECAFGAGSRPLNLSIEWNAENQLKKVLKNAATIATFAYDPFGRRVEKVAGGTTTTFTYDAEDILREIAGATTTYYVHGPGIDEPLAKEISGSLTHYHADGLGSVLKMTNASGTVTHEYRYDAYGRIEAGSTQGGYSFTGREWDPEIKLYYYRARYYDPERGSFLSADPLRYASSPNFYAYVDNKPTNLVDPFGLEIRTNVTVLNSQEGQPQGPGAASTTYSSDRGPIDSVTPRPDDRWGFDVTISTEIQTTYLPGTRNFESVFNDGTLRDHEMRHETFLKFWCSAEQWNKFVQTEGFSSPEEARRAAENFPASFFEQIQAINMMNQNIDIIRPYPTMLAR